jgi:MATE family multidrug resistance protein
VAVPIIIGQVFSLFVEMLNLVFAGHLGDPIYVAAAGLGNMYANVTCLLIIYGLNSAIATLCSQSFGAGNLRKCGVYLNKGRIAVMIFFIPIFAIMFLCEPFLLAINMDPKAAAIAQQYTYGLFVALFFQGQFDAIRQYLNSIKQSKIVTYMMITASIYHCIILYILVIVYDFGIYGCSWGTVITYIINLVVAQVYCGYIRTDLKESFFFPDKECFEDLWDYFKIGLPSSAMISLEWWSFELQAVFSSWLGIIYGGSMVIMINTLTVLTMIPFGSQIAGAVFVGNCLGEGKPSKAKVYQTLITAYTFVACAIFSALLIFYKEWVASLFTNDPDLLRVVTENFPLIGIFLIVHGIGMSYGGALRGMGKQSIATRMVFAGFYLIGHPISLILCFYFDLGMRGLTYGFICGSFSMGAFFYITGTCFSNWEQISIDVRKRHLVDGAAQSDQVQNGELKVSLMH